MEAPIPYSLLAEVLDVASVTHDSLLCAGLDILDILVISRYPRFGFQEDLEFTLSI
ncbi:hypothetical protein GAMM_280010 [Gammaproteobacteria bacterium]